MYNEKKILAIIPARGGSKGLHKKNIRMMNGIPLICYSIEHALSSKLLDAIIVSTDDAEIKTVSENAGAQVILRPEEFAKDNSPTIDAVKHVIDTLKSQGKNFDIIALLEPTSPIRKDDDIDKCIISFVDNYEGADALVSLGEVTLENPYNMKVIENNFLSPLLKSEQKFTQRQQMPKTFFPYGVMYMIKIDTLDAEKTFYPKRTMPYYIERWQNYEIDDIYDFMAVEAVINYRKNRKNAVDANKIIDGDKK
jgi:CMP-N,N'-diacetyllegionaminic acid synthase